MKEKFKSTKGITLVALIITIIVLLILAVVSINSIRSNNILQHAKDAKEDYSKAEEKEKITLAVHEAVLDGKGAINKNGVQSGMNSQFPNGWEEVSSNTDSITVKIKASGNQYKITLSSGKVEDMQGQTTGGEGDDPADADKYIAVNDTISNLNIDTMYTQAKYEKLINNNTEFGVLIKNESTDENGSTKKEIWTIILAQYGDKDENEHNVLVVLYEEKDGNDAIISNSMKGICPDDDFDEWDGKNTVGKFVKNQWHIIKENGNFNNVINGTVELVAPEKSDNPTANNQLAIFINNITHPDSN